MERKTKGENLTRQYPVESVGSFFFSCCLGRNHTLSPCYFDIKKSTVNVNVLPELLYKK